jgi:hypothetical protein
VTDAMIDLETLGNGKNAAVVQIGACFFDRVTGEVGPLFKINVDLQSAVDSGAEMDASTILWWLGPDSGEAARKSILEPGDPISLAFTSLNMFLGQCHNIWSHATFDFVIVQETLKRLRIPPKYSYRAARDIRTLMELSGVDPKSFPREGVHHDALADCIHQVKYVVAALQELRGERL